MTGKRLVGFITVMTVLIGLAATSSAAPITWVFEGTVRYENLGSASALGGSLGVSVGASAFGRLVYESTTSEAGAGSGTYPGALVEFELSIGGYSPSGVGLGTFFDFYVRPLGLMPSAPYGLEFAMANGTADPLFPTGPIVTLCMIPNAPGIIVGSALPTAPPTPSALRPFSIADWLTGIGFGTGLQLYRGDPDEQVLVELTRLAPVPEPGVAALLALLVAAACALRSRAS